MIAADGSSFSGELTTGDWPNVFAVTGAVQGDALRIHAEAEIRGFTAACRWDAVVEDSGVLSGKSMCRYRGDEEAESPEGIASVSF